MRRNLVRWPKIEAELKRGPRHSNLQLPPQDLIAGCFSISTVVRKESYHAVGGGLLASPENRSLPRRWNIPHVRHLARHDPGDAQLPIAHKLRSNRRTSLHHMLVIPKPKPMSTTGADRCKLTADRNSSPKVYETAPISTDFVEWLPIPLAHRPNHNRQWRVEKTV